MRFTSKIADITDRLISKEQYLISANVGVYDYCAEIAEEIRSEFKQEFYKMGIPGQFDIADIKPKLTGIKKEIVLIRSARFTNYQQIIDFDKYGNCLEVVHIVTADYEMFNAIINNKLNGNLTERQIFIIIELIKWIKIVEHAIENVIKRFSTTKKPVESVKKVDLVDLKPDILDLRILS